MARSAYIARRCGHSATSKSSYVNNFASQAVIAIENVRLLNELRESLEHRLATLTCSKIMQRARRCQPSGQLDARSETGCHDFASSMQLSGTEAGTISSSMISRANYCFAPPTEWMMK